MGDTLKTQRRHSAACTRRPVVANAAKSLANYDGGPGKTSSVAFVPWGDYQERGITEAQVSHHHRQCFGQETARPMA